MWWLWFFLQISTLCNLYTWKPIACWYTVPCFKYSCHPLCFVFFFSSCTLQEELCHWTKNWLFCVIAQVTVPGVVLSEVCYRWFIWTPSLLNCLFQSFCRSHIRLKSLDMTAFCILDSYFESALYNPLPSHPCLLNSLRLPSTML